MDRQKLDKKYRDDTFEKFYAALRGEEIPKAVSSKRVRLKKPKLGLEDQVLGILGQRKVQRAVVLYFLLSLIISVAVAFFWLVFWNAKTLLWTRGEVSIVDARTLQIVAVSFFVQLIFVVRSITKALWDDKNYLSPSLLNRMFVKKDK